MHWALVSGAIGGNDAMAREGPLTVSAQSSSESGTRALLTCALVAGPLWWAVVLVQMLIRPGFDIRRHAISLLSLGDLGWIQVINFIVAGTLLVAGSLGMRRALNGGRGGAWGPVLVATFGLGLIGAGVFAPDPLNGFPPGTPSSPSGLSGHGALHLLFSSASFLSLIVVSTVVFARRFAALGQRGWALCAVAAGVLVLVAWAALVVTAASSSIVNIAFPAAVALTWALITVVAAQLRGRDY